MIKSKFRALALSTAMAVAPLAAVTVLSSPIMAHAEIPAEKLGELESVYDAAISPNGENVAIFLNYNGTYGVRVVELGNPGGKPIGLLLPKGAKPGWVKWANDDRVLLSVWQSEKRGGTPYRIGSIFTFDVNENNGDWLIKPPRRRTTGSMIGGSSNFFEQFYNTVVDFLPNDPDHILMTFMDRYHNVRPVHKVDVETGKYTTVERATDDIQGWITDNEGTVRVAQGLRDNAKTLDELYMKIRGTDGEWREVDEYPGLEASTSVHGFTSNLNEMVVGLSQGRDTEGLYVYDLDQKRVVRTLFHDDTYDAGGIITDKDTGDVIGVRYTGEETTTKLLDDYDSVVEDMRKLYEGFQVRVIDTADNANTVLFSVSSPYDPGMLMIKREGADTPDPIIPIRPDVSSDEFGMVIPVRYTARDGQKIPAFVTLPPTVNDTAAIKDLPFVVLPHGGPWARDAARFDWFAQFFASRGYGVLQMNFRGSTGYGEAFAKAGRENWKVMRDDVTDGTRWLVEKGYADPERVCVAGWSYGGYAALMGGLDHPELYSCVVSIAGLSDIPGQLREMKEYRFGKAQQAYLRQGFADTNDMKENSPARRAEEMTLPTFIAHGTYDQQVQFSQHRRLHKALKKAPGEVTEMTFDEEDHYMSQQVNRQAMLVALEKFLEKANGKSEYIRK